MNRRTNISLQIKILADYIILIAIIGSMTATLFHEYTRMHLIKTGITEISRIRREVKKLRPAPVIQHAGCHWLYQDKRR